MAADMDFKRVSVSFDGALGRLTLNEPDRLNPLGPAMLDEITAAAQWFAAQAAVRVVVVAGSGRAFTAGADISDFRRELTATEARRMADRGRIAADAVEAMRAITIAQIHGHCVGGGVVLAAACDLRVAAADVRFAIPEVDLGIPLAWGGIPRLIREIGPARTKELVMTCRPFTSSEALAMGFVNRVVAPEELEVAVSELAATIAGKAPLPVLATKRHVDAVTRQMVGQDRSWSDADSFAVAYGDEQGRGAAEAYLAGLVER